MSEDYEDTYEDDHDYDDSQKWDDSQYKHYFKFDPEAWDAWGKWLYDAMNEIVENSPNVWYIDSLQNNSFPVNSWNLNTGKDNSFQYLGSNYQGSSIWKKKYFILDPINNEYKLHLQAHSKHFVQQPTYYQGLFDILN